MQPIRWLTKYFAAGFILFTASYVVVCTYRLVQDINRPFGGYVTFYNVITDRHQLAAPTPDWWSGFSFGQLQKIDHPHLIDNQPYSITNEIAAFAAAWGEGRPAVEVVVQRHSQLVAVQVPVILFTWQHFFELKAPDILITLGLFLVAVIVYRAQPDEPLNQLVVIICCIFIPSFTRASLFYHDGPLAAWAEMTMGRSRMFWGVLLFHFALLFPLAVNSRIRYLLYFWYALTLFICFVPLNLIWPTISPATAGNYGFQFFTRATFVGVICVLFRTVYVAFATHHYSPLYHRQARAFLFGLLLASPLLIRVFLNQLLGQTLPVFIQYLDLRYAFLFIPATLASLILRYRTFQSGSRLLILVPIMALSGLTANVVTFALFNQSTAFQEVSIAFLFLFSFLAIFINSLLWSTQSSWQGWFGRLFHQQRRSYDDVRRFGQQVLRQPDLSHLPQATVDAACFELGLERAAVWIWQLKQQSFYLVAQAGQWLQTPPTSLPADSAQPIAVTTPIHLHRPGVLLLNWLQPLTLYYEIVIVVPLVVAEQSVGLLALGKRWDETIFDERDLEIIELIGQQSALFLLTATQIEALRGVPQAIAEAQERERQRIAQDLHDTVQQFLGRLPFFLQASRESPEEADVIIDRCLDDIEEAARMLRHIRSDLEPTVLEQGLRHGLVYLVDRFRLDHQIEAHINIPDDIDQKLLRQTWQHIYRIVGEALNNVAKHAQATEVHIAFMVQSSGVLFRITDNGIGSSSEQRATARGQGRRGLQFMGNRIQAIGGELEIQSDPGAGMQIDAFVPFHHLSSPINNLLVKI